MEVGSICSIWDDGKDKLESGGHCILTEHLCLCEAIGPFGIAGMMSSRLAYSAGGAD
jgi:hypothetical protein